MSYTGLKDGRYKRDYSTYLSYLGKTGWFSYLKFIGRDTLKSGNRGHNSRGGLLVKGLNILR